MKVKSRKHIRIASFTLGKPKIQTQKNEQNRILTLQKTSFIRFLFSSLNFHFKV